VSPFLARLSDAIWQTKKLKRTMINIILSRLPVHLHLRAGTTHSLVGSRGSRGRVLPLGLSFLSTSRPVLQTRKELLSQLDWDRQAGKLYVIVDPLDPEGLLYLSEKEYHRERLVAISNDVTLEVLARPGSKRPTPESHSTDDTSPNSPPLFLRFAERVRKQSQLGSVRALFPNFSEEGMVSLHRGNTVELFRR
jgi:hypothetical protein